MITRKTVLVLGAGASAPYGFPVGKQLARDITQLAIQLREAIQRDAGVVPFADVAMLMLGNGTLDIADVRDFPEAFRDSGCSTVDEFVEAKGNHRFLRFVKVATIHLLTQHERVQDLFPDDDAVRRLHGEEVDWYRYLFGFLRTPNPTDFAHNQLKVITFNFDRSFEYRLFLMVRASYGLSAEDAGRLVAAIPVFHVHGALGGPRWLGESRPDSRDYSPDPSSEQQVELMDRIRLVHEELPDSELEPAWRWLEEAQTIAFIGFGYHRLLLQRLRMVGREPHCPVYGSTFGFTDTERMRIERRFEAGSERLYLTFNLKAREFLRNADFLY